MKTQIKHKRLPILTYFFSCILLLNCTGKKENVEESVKVVDGNHVELTDAQIKNAGIVLGRLEKKSISTILKVNGRIDVPPQNMVSISVPLGGYLKSSKLLPGMKITKGEVLAVMEDQQYIQLQQDFLTAKAKSVFTEGEYTRQRELNQSKATSDKVFQQTESDYKSQRILIKALYEKLRLIGINPDKLDENSLSRSINIISPISGYVSKVNVNIGKYANPSDVLFEIVNPLDIHLALNVFERDVNSLYVGQRVVAYTNTNPDKKYLCSILLIGRDLSTDRSAQVHCHFEQYDKVLIPGMFMNAEIEVKNDNSYVLPADAIVSFDKKQYVFIAKNKNEFEMAEVITGGSEKGFIAINAVSSLTDRDIVTKGAYSLLMKIKNISE